MLDLAALSAAITAQTRVARVVVAKIDGSTPREVGASMLVWRSGQSGTIGGGALEWDAVGRARAMLAGGAQAQIDRIPLGPALGQCCGGAVTLVTEVFDAATLPRPQNGLYARGIGAGEMPLGLARILDRARARGEMPQTALHGNWLVEAVAQSRCALWVWGAGHVGRAIVGVMAPLPDVAITWVDVAADRFPDTIPESVTMLPAADAAALVAHAPHDAAHLILTYSHALDLDLCHRLLAHGFADCGLIGSATKWARFRSRLAALGHQATAIDRIRCPIGDPALGKHPQAIALGVATAFLRSETRRARQEKAG